MIARLLARISGYSGHGGAGSAIVLLVVALLSALVAMLAVDHVSLLTGADRYLQDWETASLAPAQKQDPDIVIAAINEDTLSQFPYRSPVDRAFVANLLNALAAKHPRAIGLDLLLDQPTEPAKDDLLRKTLRDISVPLFVSYVDSKGVVDQAQRDFLDGFVPAHERAYANLGTDQSDTARWALPGAKAKDGRYVLSFARALAASVGVKTPDEQVPIVWHGRPASNDPAFAEYPAHLVPLLPADWFKNKIVLIGSDITLVDRHRTPFTTVLPGGEGMFAGIVIQAHILSQMIHGEHPPAVGWGIDFLIAFAVAAAAAGLGIVNLHLLPRIALGGALIVVLWIAAGLLFHYAGAMIGLIAPSLSAVAAFGAMDSLAGLDARRQREFIQGAFSRYVSPKVVEQLVRDPGKMSLDGERRVMTYIFTDVKNFTTMSEGLDSKDLARILNAYLDGITQIVLKYDGMVDKFIGDAVFAIFNAPVDLPDHAERAVKCALAIDDFCQQFHEEQTALGVPFGITRIGVHTGAAVVGNFGSHARFTYTAQGDAVNTASRLEALNKHFGTRLCVSNATRELCKTIRFRPIASVVLKGKTTAVDVWEPLHDNALGDDFLARYCTAFTMTEQNSPDALTFFTALKEEAPDDPCVALHVERLSEGVRGVSIMMTEK